MITTYASYSLEFWSHHAMLDAIWYEWQSKCQKCIYQGYFGNTERLIGFNPIQYRHNYLYSLNLGTCGIKVVYDQIFTNARLFEDSYDDDSYSSYDEEI